MVEKKEQIAPELWAPLQAQEKDSEKIEKPSLTFLQDGWRRLKQNKLAMVSMCVIILLVLGAVLIPFFWGYSYEDQTLTLSNTPPILKLYPIQDDKNDICIHITKSYDAMEVTSDGELVQLLKPTYKDVIDRRSVYDLNGEELIIDYSIYTQAMKDYNALENMRLRARFLLPRRNTCPSISATMPRIPRSPWWRQRTFWMKKSISAA